MKKNNQEFNLWLAVGVVNAAIIYLASILFPGYIVIGNEFVENWMAAILTSLLLTVALSITKPVLKAANLKVKGDLPINITYVITNIVGLWILAKLARYDGFGVTSFVVVIILGLVLSVIQYVVWKTIGGKK